MTHIEYIEVALETERLHRYVFDKLYVQNYQITDEDQIILDTYNELCKVCPDFRKVLWEEQKRLEQEKVEKFKHINFNRYGFKKGVN